MSIHRLLSACTVTTIGLVCKAFLNFGFCKSVSVTGLHHLLHALDDNERNNGRGIVTVANHISTLDDPVTWGVLPVRCYLNLRDMRWALGASDIMFTNPVFSAFFRKGQVLETMRGKGIYQPAVDSTIDKLNSGDWVHLFGEGKVNQPYQYPLRSDNGKGEVVARLPRFKWGTGRILMETKRLPVIIPMWLSGFEDIMPEPRPQSIPAKFLPRLRQHLRITFAPPLDPAILMSVLDPLREPARYPVSEDLGNEDLGRLGVEGADGLRGPLGETEEKRRVRAALTAVVQHEVEKLGYAVSGPLLGGPSRILSTPPSSSS
ncbi:acyltransferase-domain-containing protein [Phellopilus nigrolimitatus]|nr:acyltransferase-domain-containing protein [Phellopilus nigrolimitatus]